MSWKREQALERVGIDEPEVRELNFFPLFFTFHIFRCIYVILLYSIIPVLSIWTCSPLFFPYFPALP